MTADDLTQAWHEDGEEEKSLWDAMEMEVNFCLSARYDFNQETAKPVTPIVAKIQKKE